MFGRLWGAPDTCNYYDTARAGVFADVSDSVAVFSQTVMMDRTSRTPAPQLATGMDPPAGPLRFASPRGVVPSAARGR